MLSNPERVPATALNGHQIENLRHARSLLLALGLFLFFSWPTEAQNSIGSGPPAQTNNDVAPAVRAEQLRAICLQNRRCVCGRVLKVFPNGVLVESGYPSLLRDSLHGAWHLPATVIAERATNLVEKLEPDSMAIGTVFLTDLPRLRGTKIQPYDYVVLHSYPAGEYTYNSVADIHHTVRRFSGGLETAVKLIMQSEQTNAVPAAAETPKR
jgi:hypothetical protein